MSNSLLSSAVIAVIVVIVSGYVVSYSVDMDTIADVVFTAMLNVAYAAHGVLSLNATDSIDNLDGGTLELDGAMGITTFKSGTNTYAVVAALIDSGVQVLNVTDPTNITATASITDSSTLELLDASRITIFKSGTDTYVAVTAPDDDGVQILNVTDPTDITATDSITDTNTLELDGARGITTFKSGTDTYVAVAAEYDDGVQILNVTDPTDITATDSITDTTTLKLKGALRITTFKSGTDTYVAVTAYNDHGVQILNVTDPTDITATGNIGNTGTIELEGAIGITTFKSGTDTYVAVAAYLDNGIQILNVTDPTDITATSSIADTGILELNGAYGITTFELMDHTYAAVASHIDSGVQIIDITDPMNITATDNITDSSTLELFGARAITTFESGTDTYVAVAAYRDDGVQIMRVETTGLTVDTEVPVITLYGPSNVDVIINGTYNEQNARCIDNVDPEKVADVDNSAVNTGVINFYIVFYDCTDAAGNDAIQVTRVVNVVAEPDTEPPELTLTGSSSVTIEGGDPYSDAGAECTDTVDGTITPAKIFDNVDTSRVGSYTVTYSCTDAATNTVTVSRTVIVEDTTPPELTLTGSSSVTIEGGDPYSDAGAECTDTVDGTITPAKTLDDVDTSRVGSYTVTYSCTDAATNTVTVSRTVIVEDTTPPELTLTGSSSVTIEGGDPYSDAGAECTDTVDGTITPAKTLDDVDTSRVGSYTVTYSCTDAATNTVTVSRTVIVEDTTPPELTLTGSSSVTIEVDDPYSDAGAECTDTVDGTITPAKTLDDVDTSQVGSYTVTYSCTDAATNTVTVSRTVNVETSVEPDTDAPVIALRGNASVTIEVNNRYADAGAECTDTVDGTITPIKTLDDVDTSQVGTYTVTYSCADTATNTVTVSRTVTVEAASDNSSPPPSNTTPPVTSNTDRSSKSRSSNTPNPLTTDDSIIIDGQSYDLGSGTTLINPFNVTTGQATDIVFTAYSPSDIVRFTIYLNLHGDDIEHSDSDTYIRYDHGAVQIVDPHGFISDASITITEDLEQSRNKIINTLVEFEGNMGLTNMSVYIWNEDRRYTSIRVFDALNITPGTEMVPDSVLPADPGPVSPDFADGAANPEPVPADALWPAGDYDEAQALTLVRMWSGFESEMITDTQLLELLGLEGYQDVDLPDWMMTELGVLVARGDVTVDEFMLALQYVLTHA